MKMKNRIFHVWAVLTLSVLLAVHFGCARSSPARFYVLSSAATAGPEIKPSADGECLSLGIGPVKIPAYLDQPQIVTRISPNEIKKADFDRWAENFNDNFTRVLVKDLSSLLCTKTIVLFPWRGGVPLDYRIEMELLRLDGSLGGNASLEAWWMIFSGDGKKMVFSKKSAFTEAVSGKDYNSLISAQSRAVDLLSREIAEAIKTQPK